jgi:hypothetical protein
MQEKKEERVKQRFHFLDSLRTSVVSIDHQHTQYIDRIS